MNIFNGIKAAYNAFMNATTDNTNVGTAIPSWEIGQPQWTHWDMNKAITDAYQANAIVYACMKKKQDAIASVPWVTKSGEGSRERTLENHKLTELLKKPNPYTSGFDLFISLANDMDLAGEHYWYLESKKEIYRLKPNRVNPVPGINGEISYYEYTVGSDIFNIPAEFVTQFKYFNPSNDYRGMSPLLPGGRMVDIDNSALVSGYKSFGNRVTPGGIMTTEQNLSKEQFKNIKAHLKESLQGEANHRNVPMMSGGFKFQQVSLTPVELDYILTIGMTGKGIHVVLGIQPESTGFADATFVNKKEANLINWTETYTPLLTLIRETINLKFVNNFGKGLHVDYNTSNTPAVLEARKEKSNEAKNYFAMGVPFNQINTELSLGFDPVDGGDVGYLPLNLVPAGESYQSNDTTTMKNKAVNITSSKNLQSYIKQVFGMRFSLEKAGVVQFKKLFKAEQTEVMKDVKANKYSKIDKTIDGFKSRWEKTFKALWKTTFDDFAELVNSSLEGQKSIIFSKATDPWTDEVDKFVSKVVADKVVNVLKTTKDRIKKQIADGIQNEEGVIGISKRIRELYEDSMTPYRSVVIARTEALSASGYASNETAKQSGIIKKKRWVTFTDGRERDSHLKIDGEERNLDAKYSNGLEYPGDPSGDADEVIQCRCTEQYFT